MFDTTLLSVIHVPLAAPARTLLTDILDSLPEEGIQVKLGHSTSRHQFYWDGDSMIVRREGELRFLAEQIVSKAVDSSNGINIHDAQGFSYRLQFQR